MSTNARGREAFEELPALADAVAGAGGAAGLEAGPGMGPGAGAGIRPGGGPGSRAEIDPEAGHGDEHFRHSYTKDRAVLLRRLKRIEGQVRGISRMIEREEYCVDILQQTSALRAAVDALGILILEDHVRGCLRQAAEQGDADQMVDEVIDVVRRTMGRPVRTGTRAG